MNERQTMQADQPGDPGMDAFLRYAELRRETVTDFKRYPFAIPAVRDMERLEFHKEVTFLVGENGSGKSTLIVPSAMLPLVQVRQVPAAGGVSGFE